jgi:hypothetical protein
MGCNPARHQTLYSTNAKMLSDNAMYVPYSDSTDPTSQMFLNLREVFILGCVSCRSSNESTFVAETNIHFSELRNLNRPGVLVFPKVTICLDCGFTHCTLPERELCQLREDRAA